MKRRNSILLLISVIIILDIIAIIMSSGITGKLITKDKIITVSELYESSLLGDTVRIRGKVSLIMEDHISEKGFRYQQFLVSDWEREIKFFCSVKYGEADVEKGDEVIIDGKFQKFYMEFEVYGFCSEVRKV